MAGGYMVAPVPLPACQRGHRLGTGQDWGCRKSPHTGAPNANPFWGDDDKPGVHPPHHLSVKLWGREGAWLGLFQPSSLGCGWREKHVCGGYPMQNLAGGPVPGQGWVSLCPTAFQKVQRRWGRARAFLAQLTGLSRKAPTQQIPSGAKVECITHHLSERMFTGLWVGKSPPHRTFPLCHAEPWVGVHSPSSPHLSGWWAGGGAGERFSAGSSPACGRQQGVGVHVQQSIRCELPLAGFSSLVHCVRRHV